MSSPRSEIADALLNNKIYIIGAFENGHSINTVEVYDPLSDKWSSVAPLPQPLDHAAAAASYNGKMYVVGGGGYLDRNILSNKLFIYDPV